MTTKISWNQYNRMPHDTFRWRGMDGSEILVHFITTPSPSRIYTYNGVITPRTVQGIWDAYQDKGVNQDLLLAYGYGDGGGGVNREMLEMRRRLEAMPGLPRVVTGRATDYFEALKDTVAGTDQYVHTWDGELYLEIHRGTYTSQAYSKRTNRKLELALRETEWLAVLGSLSRADWLAYPQAELNEAWRILLRHQFHDILPGSSIREVYEDSEAEYAEAEGLVQEAWQHAVGDAGAADNTFTVPNSSSRERADYVRVRPPASTRLVASCRRSDLAMTGSCTSPTCRQWVWEACDSRQDRRPPAHLRHSRCSILASRRRTIALPGTPRGI